MSSLETALGALRRARLVSPKALIAYSDGKDSRAVTDLASRIFEELEGFYMFIVPGLEHIEVGLEAARKRWGIKIRQYPHWLVYNFISGGVFCTEWFERDHLPEWKLVDVYALAMQETGVPFVLTGAKRADGIWRRRFMRNMQKQHREILNPIEHWTKFDVVSYLRTRGIQAPVGYAGRAGGVDLSVASLLWLNDTWPQDFKKVCEVFPFAEAVVWQRRFYGGG